MSDSEPDREPIAWHEVRAKLEALWREHTLRLDEPPRSFVAEVPSDGGVTRIRFIPPSLLPIADGETDAARYLESLADHLGRNAVVLVQAGATALGLWDDDELIAHKVIKKYVVRGHGRAQPLHLKTRGKSRYGSRLRLQNYGLQLEQTNEKLHEWWTAHGPFASVHLACAKRIEPDLAAAEPGFPWAPGFAVGHVPFHVHVPDFAELKRIRWLLAHGEIVRSIS